MMDRLTHERCSGIKTGYWSANKKDELIDRLAEYENTGLTPEEIVTRLDPNADVVEVVRCKECKHRGHGEECPMFHLVWLEADRYGWEDFTMDEYYCSDGERKEINNDT